MVLMISAYARYSSISTGATRVIYANALPLITRTELPLENDHAVEVENTEPIIKLTDLLARHFSNPFHHYSRFTACVEDVKHNQLVANYAGVRSLSVLIFLTSRQPDGPPLAVHINVTNAKIVDLIGLVLWLYFNEGHSPPLPYV